MNENCVGDDDIFVRIQQAVDGDDWHQLSTLLMHTGLIDRDAAEEHGPLYLRLLKTVSQAKQRHNHNTSPVIIAVSQ